MKNIIKAIRLPECLLVVFLGFLGFKFSGAPTDTLTLTTLFFIIASTMIQNGWRDRHHDTEKGKTISRESPFVFIPLLFIFWILCGILVSIVFLSSPPTAVLLFGMMVVGLFYSEARHVPFLSIFLVTITVASSTLLPLGFGSSFLDIFPLFLLTAILMFGRENLHDIADTTVDIGYKKTIPVILGAKFARTASIVSLVVGCIVATTISPITIPGSILILLGVLKTMKDAHLVQVRRKVDTGLVLLVIGFLII